MNSLWLRVFAACAAIVVVTLTAAAIFSTGFVPQERTEQLIVLRGPNGEVRAHREAHVRTRPGLRLDPAAASDAQRRKLLLGFLVAGSAALIVTFVLVRSILGPLQRLSEAVRRIASGDLHARAPAGGGGEMAQLVSDFNAMAASMERTERMRTELARDVAHELRAPLTALRCRLDAVRDGVDPLVPALVEELSGDLRGLERLVDDLNQLAVMRDATISTATRPCSVADVAGPVVRAYATPAASRDIALRLDVPNDLPPIAVDPDRIRQVVANLVENALRHTPAGGEIVVSASHADGSVEIAVRDNGEGFPSADATLLFERFYRADPSRSRETGGAGLGLAIARQLVEAHGGAIRASGAPGCGATFAFTVPAAAG
jgi:signal transduction histidine kinase